MWTYHHSHDIPIIFPWYSPKSLGFMEIFIMEISSRPSDTPSKIWRQTRWRGSEQIWHHQLTKCIFIHENQHLYTYLYHIEKPLFIVISNYWKYLTYDKYQWTIWPGFPTTAVLTVATSEGNAGATRRGMVFTLWQSKMAGKSSKIEVNSWDNHLQMGSWAICFHLPLPHLSKPEGEPWIISLSHLPKKPDWTCHHGHGQPAIHQWSMSHSLLGR